ncbi:hypothetical protein G7K_5466-t1 [Saitoella complicata NRRL Y-17804]|uniref:Uncharacterized protein n=1 Tax=Saitoella complicata (strain BCRC 22490 / CBS 7301 / JCM 7358 / NBRC 10748 / NRRL Y-17804) TaxID=698492 RepID=A0A0E9NNG7_SAICN|nr:hypothetical protein G7K_5466-t1 [Saitoella complicata NRRL Y-17804]
MTNFWSDTHWGFRCDGPDCDARRLKASNGKRYIAQNYPRFVPIWHLKALMPPGIPPTNRIEVGTSLVGPRWIAPQRAHDERARSELNTQRRITLADNAQSKKGPNTF